MKVNISPIDEAQCIFTRYPIQTTQKQKRCARYPIENELGLMKKSVDASDIN
jgi:hypothetical protein